MKNVQISFDENLLNTLDNIVVSSQLSRSAVVREALRNWIRQREIQAFENERDGGDISPAKLIATGMPQFKTIDRDRDTTAAILYTGGTTGIPKGAMLSHANIQTSLLNRDRLAGFKGPKEFVVVDELPKNPAGKLLKREIRKQYRTNL